MVLFPFCPDIDVPFFFVSLSQVIIRPITFEAYFIGLGISNSSYQATKN